MKKEKKVEEKENNNNRKVLLSIIALLFLVFAVVGVSFAFFTYTRASENNNVITTGQVVFNFDNDKAPSGKVDPGDPEDPNDDKVIPGDDLTLTNSEPMPDEEGKEQDEKFGFGIDATIPENLDELPFKIYAVEGAVPTQYNECANEECSSFNQKNYEKPAIMGRKEDGGTYLEADRMDYQFVSLYVKADETHSKNAEDINSTIETKYSTGNYKLTADVKATDKEKKGTSGGVLIAQGKIPNDNIEHTYSYTLRMWINTDLKVSDTNAPQGDGIISYRASDPSTGLFPAGKTADTDTNKDGTKRRVYGDLFYSLKIRIEAGSQVGISG